MRIFLDANVLFSASNPDSAFSRLVGMALRLVDVVTSDVACAEARRNLGLKRQAWLPTFEVMVAQRQGGGTSGMKVVPSAMFDLPIDLADKDVPLLCAAIAARADYFVTGDRRDFGHLFDRSVLGVRVITPKQLAEILLELTSSGEQEP